MISTHTSRVGCDDGLIEALGRIINFYSHIPCGMWHRTERQGCSDKDISTHTSRVGCDDRLVLLDLCFFYFYSHIPCGMWRYLSPVVMVRKNFYSHIPCGMWLRAHVLCVLTAISTHTSRVGCDEMGRLSHAQAQNFYSHIPCGMWHNAPKMERHSRNFYSHIPCGMWPNPHRTIPMFLTFLLTHPVWDVTVPPEQQRHRVKISTHTSRVGCDSDRLQLYPSFTISTHTSRVGCDIKEAALRRIEIISTHTSRVGCDRYI